MQINAYHINQQEEMQIVWRKKRKESVFFLAWSAFVAVPFFELCALMRFQLGEGGRGGCIAGGTTALL